MKTAVLRTIASSLTIFAAGVSRLAEVFITPEVKAELEAERRRALRPRVRV